MGRPVALGDVFVVDVEHGYLIPSKALSRNCRDPQST